MIDFIKEAWDFYQSLPGYVKGSSIALVSSGVTLILANKYYNGKSREEEFQEEEINRELRNPDFREAEIELHQIRQDKERNPDSPYQVH